MAKGATEIASVSENGTGRFLGKVQKSELLQSCYFQTNSSFIKRYTQYTIFRFHLQEKFVLRFLGGYVIIIHIK